MVQRSVFRRAEVNNSHWPIYFSKEQDALAHKWPSAHLSAFPLIALLPQVIRLVREFGCSVLLVPPIRSNQMWFPKLIYLLPASPWPILLRKDVLFQARDMIWYTRPELWSLYV